ncbi:hypothetical protein HDU99_006537 [Rhizoclosmatium hyalinum]|nr:hypothetical protein HDU99_006537 [Rhizoclosmatium hyalinum]
MAEDAVHSNSKPTKIFGEPAPLLQRPLRKGQAEGLSLHKFKPQRPMDPDLAREYLVLKDPSLTSKERRQLRNKLSARSFRERRKELSLYIDTLEAELRRVVNENVAIQEEFEKGEQERDELRRRVEELEALVAGVKISGEKESDCKSGFSSGSGSGRRNDLREVGVHTVCVPEVSVSAAAALLERDLRTEAVERWLSGVEEDEVEVLKRVGRRRSVFVENKVKDVADVSDALMQFAASVACTAVSVFYRPAPVVNEEEDVNDDVETLCGDEPEVVSLPPVVPTLNQEPLDDDDDDASLHEEEVMDPLTRLLESLDVGSVGRNASEEEDIVLWRLLQRKQ